MITNIGQPPDAHDRSTVDGLNPSIFGRRWTFFGDSLPAKIGGRFAPRVVGWDNSGHDEVAKCIECMEKAGKKGDSAEGGEEGAAEGGGAAEGDVAEGEASTAPAEEGGGAAEGEASAASASLVESGSPGAAEEGPNGVVHPAPGPPAEYSGRSRYTARGEDGALEGAAGVTPKEFVAEQDPAEHTSESPRTRILKHSLLFLEDEPGTAGATVEDAAGEKSGPRPPKNYPIRPPTNDRIRSAPRNAGANHRNAAGEAPSEAPAEDVIWSVSSLQLARRHKRSPVSSLQLVRRSPVSSLQRDDASFVARVVRDDADNPGDEAGGAGAGEESDAGAGEAGDAGDSDAAGAGGGDEPSVDGAETADAGAGGDDAPAEDAPCPPASKYGKPGSVVAGPALPLKLAVNKNDAMPPETWSPWRWTVEQAFAESIPGRNAPETWGPWRWTVEQSVRREHSG